MQSSNLAVNLEDTATDLLVQPPRPQLTVITNDGPIVSRANRRRPSLEFRSILIRDQGLRSFRVF